MKKHLRDRLIPKGRTIFFNEEEHKYTNELGYTYTSVTTIIGKYTEDFKTMEIAKACERIGRNPNHKDYLRYKNKTANQLVKEWKVETKVSCDFGSKKHNFLENAVKDSTGYKVNSKGYIKDKITTIDDIIEHHNYGRLTPKKLEKTGLKEKYPEIYKILIGLHKAGYNIYAEIGVYDDTYGVSGLIDILCINFETFDFIILDWKTNKAPIRFDSGYYKKKLDGKLDLNQWVPKEGHFAYPLNHLPDSVGHHYTMQLSTYAYLVTTFGFTFKGLVLCHIRPIEDSLRTRDEWEEKVEIYKLDFLKEDAMMMLDDFKTTNIKTQGLLMFN